MPLTDPLDRKLAFVPGAEVARCRRTRRKACCSPAIRASAAASSRPTRTTSRLGSGWRGIVTGDGRMSVRAAAGIFYGSITGNEWNTTADNQPFTVRQSIPDGVHAVRSVSQPAGRRRSVPVRVRPGEPAIHASGAGLRSVARFRLAEDLSGERHRGEAAVPRLQRDARRTSARSAATCPRASIATIRSTVPAPPRRTSTRGGRISPASSARRACSNRSSTSDYHAPADERRAARRALLGEGLLHVRKGR